MQGFVDLIKTITGPNGIHVALVILIVASLLLWAPGNWFQGHRQALFALYPWVEPVAFWVGVVLPAVTLVLGIVRRLIEPPFRNNLRAWIGQRHIKAQTEIPIALAVYGAKNTYWDVTRQVKNRVKDCTLLIDEPFNILAGGDPLYGVEKSLRIWYLVEKSYFEPDHEPINQPLPLQPSRGIKPENQ